MVRKVVNLVGNYKSGLNPEQLSLLCLKIKPGGTYGLILCFFISQIHPRFVGIAKLGQGVAHLIKLV